LIYDELIKNIQIKSENALEAFEEWSKKENKINY